MPVLPPLKLKFVPSSTLKWGAAMVAGGAIGGGLSSLYYSGPLERERFLKSQVASGAAAAGVAALGIRHRGAIARAAVDSAKYVFRKIRGRVIRIRL